jgi:hypothetical protein
MGSPANNARLTGRAVYIAHGNWIRFGGTNLIVGQQNEASQFFTQSHTGWTGANGKLYGVLASNSGQMNINNIEDLTITGMIITNLYTSNRPDEPWGPSGGVHSVNQSIPGINNRIKPNPDPNIVLSPGALNPSTPFMVRIEDYTSGGTGDTWKVTEDGSAQFLTSGPVRIGILR